MSQDAEILFFQEQWLGETDVWPLREGRHLRPWEKLGAHPCALGAVVGAAFAVWARTAQPVSVVGDFNGWDPQQHAMRDRSERGAWELFVPCDVEGALYEVHVGSWGSQPTGLYAPTARYGTPQAFRDFVAAAHAVGLPLLLDWVPAHFPADAHALAHLDGTALFETADPCEGVQRVDALASMPYHDDSRPEGECVPHQDGRRENYEVIDFLREVNRVLEQEAPGATTVAKESTAVPGVTAPRLAGGLGFHYMWNLGWMHDTLTYFAVDPVHRSHHHDRISFAMKYAYSEYFVLALSHNEAVHGKGSLNKKMWGDPWQKRVNLRALYALMYAHPGRKLLFVGSELAQTREWTHDGEFDWHLLDNPGHAHDDEPEGFGWSDVQDRAHFGGCGVGNDGAVVAELVPWQGYADSVVLGLPPLGVLWLESGAGS